LIIAPHIAIKSNHKSPAETKPKAQVERTVEVPAERKL
jgi:hypothetical protein